MKLLRKLFGYHIEETFHPCFKIIFHKIHLKNQRKLPRKAKELLQIAAGAA